MIDLPTSMAAKACVTAGAVAAPWIAMLGLPGMWLALAVAGGAEWWTEERLFSAGTAVGCLGLTVAAEAWEFTASSVRASRAGARRRGAVGALLGGVGGALGGTLVMPVVGTLIGGGLGALLGSALLERTGGRTLREALRIGRAAAKGQMLGVAGKLGLATVLCLWLTAAVWMD